MLTRVFSSPTGPGLLASAQAGGPIRLPSVGGEKENLDQEPAGRPVDENTNAINEGQAQLDRPKSSVPQVKKELRSEIHPTRVLFLVSEVPLFLLWALTYTDAVLRGRSDLVRRALRPRQEQGVS